MELKTFLNFEFDPKVHAHTPSGISRTIPDMSYTIQEILNKAINGNSLAVQRLVQYGGDQTAVHYMADPLTETENAIDSYEAKVRQRQAAEKALKAKSGASQSVKTDESSDSEVNNENS